MSASTGRADARNADIMDSRTEIHAVIIRWVAGSLSDPVFRKAIEQRTSGRPDEQVLLDEIRAAERKQEELAKDWAAERITRREWLAASSGLAERISRARSQLAQDSTVRVLDGVPSALDALQGFLRDPDVPVARRRGRPCRAGKGDRQASGASRPSPVRARPARAALGAVTG
jgi:hypothetical protein